MTVPAPTAAAVAQPSFIAVSNTLLCQSYQAPFCAPYLVSFARLAIADLDGDGLADVVVTRTVQPTDGSIVAFLSDGRGGFRSAPSEVATGWGPGPPALGDLNGDGIVDVALVSGDGGVWVHFGDGAGGFGPGIRFATGGLAPTGPIALADIATSGHPDPDGRLDIVVAGTGEGPCGLEVTTIGQIAVLRNDGTGGFADVSTASTATGLSCPEPRTLAVGDLNGDGRADVVVGTPFEEVRVLDGSPIGGFLAPQVYPTLANALTVALGDVNGDDRRDVVTTNADIAPFFDNPGTGPVQVLLGASGGGLGGATQHATSLSGTGNPAVANLTGDGPDDVAVAGRMGFTFPPPGFLAVLPGGPGAAALFPLREVANSGPALVATGDLDGDGKADVVVLLLNYQESRLVVLLNTSSFPVTGGGLARLHVTVRADEGAGGTVLITPGDIVCSDSCDVHFPVSTQAVLTPVPADPDSAFTGWSGAECIGLGSCAVPMDAHQSVVAFFTRRDSNIRPGGVSTSFANAAAGTFLLQAFGSAEDWNAAVIQINGVEADQLTMLTDSGSEIEARIQMAAVESGPRTRTVYVLQGEYPNFRISPLFNGALHVLRVCAGDADPGDGPCPTSAASSGAPARLWISAEAPIFMPTPAPADPAQPSPFCDRFDPALEVFEEIMLSSNNGPGMCYTADTVPSSCVLIQPGNVSRCRRMTLRAPLPAAGTLGVTRCGREDNCRRTPTEAPGVGTLTVLPGATLDADGNGTADVTDARIILRYLAGVPDRQLLSGIPPGAGATRTAAAAIRAYLDASRALTPVMLDADGDGQFAALTDGRLIYRFLSGVTGPALVAGSVLGPGATRTTAAAVEAHLQGFVPAAPTLVAAGAPAPSGSSITSEGSATASPPVHRGAVIAGARRAAACFERDPEEATPGASPVDGASRPER